MRLEARQSMMGARRLSVQVEQLTASSVSGEQNSVLQVLMLSPSSKGLRGVLLAGTVCEYIDLFGFGTAELTGNAHYWARSSTRKFGHESGFHNFAIEHQIYDRLEENANHYEILKRWNLGKVQKKENFLKFSALMHEFLISLKFIVLVGLNLKQRSIRNQRDNKN